MSESVVRIVQPGTLLRMFPQRQTGRPFIKRETLSGKQIPFEGNPVFEVERYIFDKEGGHVTFERQEGTFYMQGLHARDIEFPYPHPMFEIVAEEEANKIKASWKAANDSYWESRRWKWPKWLRLPRAQSVATV